MRTLPLMLFAALATGCSAKVQRGLDEKQANEIISALHARGLAAEKVPEGGRKATFTVEVADGDEKDAIRILGELGLPHPKPEGFHELFAGGGLVTTPVEERARYLAALGGELAKTLESVEGVLQARVHLVAPPPPRLGQPAAPAKASAFLRVAAASVPRVRAQREELASIVAGAVEGLSVESVSLVITEVAKTEIAVRPPSASNATQLRLALMGLSLVVSALAIAVAALVLRLRRVPKEPAPALTSARQSTTTARKAA